MPTTDDTRSTMTGQHGTFFINGTIPGKFKNYKCRLTVKEIESSGGGDESVTREAGFKDWEVTGEYTFLRTAHFDTRATLLGELVELVLWRDKTSANPDPTPWFEAIEDNLIDSRGRIFEIEIDEDSGDKEITGRMVIRSARGDFPTVNLLPTLST